MQLIHDAGWTTVNTDQLHRWLDGEPVPPHSVMITFDDGAKGVWQYADPVLRRLNMHASAFIITGFVGTRQPYYMTWEEITDLHRSGRWDLQAHTHLGHVMVPVDASGAVTAPFLANRMWLPDQARLETHPEYADRVYGDLLECKRQFGMHGFPEPAFFAYPFSAHEGEGDSAGTDYLRRTVSSLYRFAMLDDANLSRTSSSSDILNGLIQRMDITGSTTTDGVVAKIMAASPIDPADAEPFADPSGWVDESLNPQPVEVVNGVLTINPDPHEKVVRDYQPVRTTAWNRYSVSADLSGFIDETWSAAGIAVLKPSSHAYSSRLPHQLDVTVDIDTVTATDQQGNVLLPITPVGSGFSHHLDIDVTPDVVTITVDGRPPAMINVSHPVPRVVAGGFSLFAYRQSDASPPLAFSNLEISTKGE
jgi:hypothetical protein